MATLAIETNSHIPEVDAFEQSFPLRYSALFDKVDRAHQAKVCARRLPGEVSVGLIPSRKAGQSAVCVCAEDVPGILALTSAALSTLGFEIETAVAYRRSMPMGEAPEILDVFWLRDPSGIVSMDDAAAIANLLSEYLAGRPGRDLEKGVGAASSPSGTVVRFRGDARGELSVLEVETSDRFGLLWQVSRALADCEVQIVSSEISTEGVRVTDTFIVEEITGGALGIARRLEIQSAVLAALES